MVSAEREAPTANHSLEFDAPEAAVIAGVDEAGRGPLAGPVVAAAVVLDEACPIQGLADSKVLSPGARERLDRLIKRDALAWAVGRAAVEEIDRVNILQASLVAMQRAVAALGIMPQHVLVDGNRAPAFACAATPIVKGDSKVPAISAASIVAKVTRDREMLDWDVRYPGYGFARHKGYATKHHLQMLKELGPCPCHRKSFAPVRNALHREVGRSEDREGEKSSSRAAVRPR